ncbi:hypothetical protein CR513_22052, partial [Mucuna pruriens]
MVLNDDLDISNKISLLNKYLFIFVHVIYSMTKIGDTRYTRIKTFFYGFIDSFIDELKINIFMKIMDL